MKKILIFCLPALGDVLLATPLIRSLKKAYPDCQIDMMIRQGTQGILEGNPDVHEIFTCQKYAGFRDYLEMIKSIAFSYDLTISTSASDRAFWCSLLSSRKRFTITKPFRCQDFWKYLGTHKKVADDHEIHVVERNLRLVDLLNIPRCYDLVPPYSEKDLPEMPHDFVILHAFPRKPFKLWNVERWQEIITYFHSMNLKVVLTGGSCQEEIEYLRQLETDNTITLAGKLSLAQSSAIIQKAKLFVGIDTGTTHLATATGIPTIALFGPTSPVRWGPWPKDYQSTEPPFSAKVGTQTVKNVTVITAPCHCVFPPNFSHENEKTQSKCMREITVEQVKAAIDQRLAQ